MRVHIVIEGLVQGVGYRWFAARRAESMGIRGWVRNNYDGNVELEAVADRSLLEELIKDLKVGPRASRVTNLRVEWKEDQPHEFHRFEIR